MFKISNVTGVEHHMIGGWQDPAVKGFPSYSTSKLIVYKYTMNGVDYMEIPFSRNDHQYLRNMFEAGVNMKCAAVRDTVLG